MSNPVREHYEKYPYPSYPLFLLGSWKDLERVDLDRWGLNREARDLWIVGCGSISALMFGRRNPRTRILATDLSSTSLRRLRMRLWLHGVHNVRLEQDDFLNSERVNDFDAIDCYGVLHHIEEPKTGLHKLARALRPGGVLRLMLYSMRARAEIEKLRSRVQALKIANLKTLTAWMDDEEIARLGELSSASGLADALLHPLVHVFDEHKLRELIDSEKTLEVVKLEEKSNFILTMRKNS
ncbi:MAG: hypothetical protein COV44_10100 [Deltaproteobacteria bacterium CG11_big_fil_rev_8_21_14_0_20_45_16]|nr:MAG: hypothetical protein COV44_10100 [Deltaproteobacteria bacterium CG11_big_fil_rev_8_21_14_0_20_45_16]